MTQLGLLILFGLGAAFFWKLARSIRLVPQKKEFIVERLGRYHQTLGAGFHVLIPFIDRVAFIQDLKEESMEVPPQECFTRDNVKVEVDGVIYISVTDSKRCSYGTTDYRYAAIQLAQTTTRSIVGTLELDKTFVERDLINSRVVQVLDEVSVKWGIKVHRYEVKNIVPPPTTRDAMERQMAAERERRALLARTEGEKQAMINESEGMKAEAINRSEGDMQRRINEAQGRAEEILAIANATAESIEKMGAALTVEGGAEAIRLRLSQSYLGKLKGVARAETRVLVPADITNVDALLKSVGLDHEAAQAQAEALAKERLRLPEPSAADAVVPPPAPSDAAPTEAPSATPEPVS